jgi:tetratricopeptide (TPR) repeat protein
MMRARFVNYRAILIGMALVILLAVAPERGNFPSAVDIRALELARISGADMEEWRLLARFVSARPNDAALWERMGVLDHRNGLCKQAVFEFGLVARYGKLSTTSLIPYAECLVEQSRFNDAIDLLGPQSKGSEIPSGLEQLLARAYIRLGDVVNASNVIRNWAARESQDPQAIYYNGLYQALSDPVGAIATLQKAAGMSPEYENAFRQVQTAVNLGQLQDNPAYQALVLGRAYGSLGEWELAQYAFVTAVRADPLYAEAHAWLGEAQQQLGGDGSVELKQALTLNPDSILAQAMNALSLQRQGDAQGALEVLEKIASQEPEDPEWLIALGQSRAITGDLENALVEFQKAVALQPNNVMTWQALADFSLAYQYAVDSDGIPAAIKAVLLAPDNAHSLDLAGQAALVNGKLSEAEDYFTKAVEQDPRYAPAHLHLALVLLQYEDFSAAIAELEKAASLGNPEAENLLEQLKAQ